MSRLFGRRARLTVDRFQVDSREGLHFRFDVEKSTEREPNTATVTVWNLAPDRRERLQSKERAVVLLEVGYEDGDLEELFRGELRVGASRREQGDVITELESGDGEQSFRGARVSISANRDFDAEKAARAVADALKVEAGNSLEAFKERGLAGVTDRYESGTVLDGPAADELERVAKSAGLEWSIQGGRLLFLPRGQGIPGAPVLLADDGPGGRNTGLIGTPTIDSEGDVEARALLTPDLHPGRRVRVRGGDVNAIGRIVRAKYTGSAFERAWYADLTVRPEGRP